MQLPQNDFLIEELICNDSFQQYCLGTNVENHLLWEDWINNLPERASDIENAKKIVDILTARQGSRLQQFKDLKNGFKQKEALSLLLDGDTSGKTLYQTSRIFYNYISFAAAAVIILFSIYFFPDNYLPFKKTQSGMDLSASVFFSGAALRKTIIMTDGTVITLNKNSEVRLIENFNPAKRELWLKGEAFFEVKHDARHPFTVHTSLNDIKVLGTSFNVKACAQSPVIETSLIQGSIQVKSKIYPGYTVLLKPGQKLLYNNITTQKSPDLKKIFIVSSLERAHADHKPKEIQWLRNQMIIDNEPLALIAEKLQKWYGIEIYITDNEVKNYRYSGTFENESIIKTLEALQIAYPFEFKATQNRITITK